MGARVPHPLRGAAADSRGPAPRPRRRAAPPPGGAPAPTAGRRVFPHHSDALRHCSLPWTVCTSTRSRRASWGGTQTCCALRCRSPLPVPRAVGRRAVAARFRATRRLGAEMQRARSGWALAGAGWGGGDGSAGRGRQGPALLALWLLPCLRVTESGTSATGDQNTRQEQDGAVPFRLDTLPSCRW